MKPKPHLEKLTSTFENPKLPPGDKGEIQKTIERYKIWIEAIEGAKKLEIPEKIIKRMVRLLNEYKLFVELELIFDSEEDFLYRQKGQLKIDNSIIEEFLPHLIIPEILPGIKNLEIEVGPTNTYSSIYFNSTLENQYPGGGLQIRSKNQDFTIGRKLYIQSSYDSLFSEKVTKSTYIAYVAAECKTNLDKTMFQEANATAHDIKTALPGAKYFLLCEWLDMTPISTAPTDIDEVIILRKAKRLNSNKRSEFNYSSKRKVRREEYKEFLLSHPISEEMIIRFVDHIKKLIEQESLVEESVIDTGFF